MAFRERGLDYYRKNLKLYLAQMENGDLFSMKDTNFRHKAITTQISVMEKLMPILESVSNRITQKDKDNLFPELRTFIRHVDYFKKYTDEFSIDIIDDWNNILPEAERIQDTGPLKQLETSKQLDMIVKIEKFEDFIDKISTPVEKKEKKKQGTFTPSLADLRII